VSKFSKDYIKFGVPILFFIIIAWFLLTFRITDVPPGINGDEAAIGYSAILVSKTGHDETGRLLPLFTTVLKSDDWKQPVTFYSEVLAFRLFGPSYFLLRAVSVVYVLVGGVLIFFLVKELLDYKMAFVSLFIYITIPIIMIQSHLALENIAPVPFVALWLLMLAKYKNKKSIRYILIAGFSLGVSLYSYFGFRLITPVLSFMTMCLILYLNDVKLKKNLKHIFIFCLIILPFVLLMIAVKNQYPGAIFGYGRVNKVASYQELAMPFLSSFDPTFLFIKGDDTPYHSTGKQGMFLMATLPLFVLGILKIAQKKDPFLVFILMVFFFSPILYSFVPAVHRASRLLVLVPSFVVIATLGFEVLFTLKNKFWKLILIAIITLLLMLNYHDFLNDYWYEYPKRVRSDFLKPIHLAFDKLQKISTTENLEPFYQSQLELSDIITYKFFEKVYFPKGLEQWSPSGPMPEKSAAIVHESITKEISNENLRVIKFDNYDFAILINDK